MQHAPPLMVFTDLDGTLLDHRTYDWSPARPALQRLAAIGAPVILSSSKTGAEIAALQRDMDLTAYPAIVENGAGLLGDDTGGSPAPYAELRRILDRLPAPLRARFSGFGDMTTAQIAKVTGLTQAQAALAQQRAFSEPGLWLGNDVQRDSFLHHLGQYGVTARMGGRFLTLSFGATKADRMAQLIAEYRPQCTIALGDAPNDVEMLQAADIGVIIANPHHPPLPPLATETQGRIIRTDLAGPTGWNAAILSLLDQYDLSKGGLGHG